jgi:hypothetical protein
VLTARTGVAVHVHADVALVQPWAGSVVLFQGHDENHRGMTPSALLG